MLVKCGHCGEKLEKSESESYKKKYYHSLCLKYVKKESEDYKNLIEYIEYLYGKDYPFIIIKKQIKEYKDEGMKYSGMRLALEYFYESLGNSVEGSKGVGIIPFIYEDAKNEYIKLQNIRKSLKEHKQESKVVTVSKAKKNNNKKMINMEDI